MFGTTSVKTKNGKVTLGTSTGSLVVPGKWKTIPANTIRNITLEDGAAAYKRLTVTRIAIFGIFALGMPKTKGGEKYLIIETNDEYFTFEIDRKNVPDAHKFINAARKAGIR